MKAKPSVAAIVLVAAALVACAGPQATVMPATSVGSNPPTTAALQVQPTETQEASGADASSYVACQIVTAEDVANLIGGTVFRKLEQEPSPNCMYEIKAGPKDYTQLIAYIYQPANVEPMIETMPETLGKPVAGLGDVAYLDFREDSQTYDLIVLVRGRFGLEVLGDNEEWVLSLGRLFLSRLLGP